MNKILIDNYRGFDIEFETSNEKFQCIITDELVKESISFSAVKKFIDDYKKTNQEFKPFYVESTPGGYRQNVKLKIIGIRKDGRFVAENSKGEKIQVSDYDIKDYMIYKKENESGLKLLSDLKEKEAKQGLENDKSRKEIISTINIVTLKDFKLTLL